jgi:CheY-like chemotaxis protein
MRQMKVLLIEDDPEDVDIYIELFESVKVPVDYLIANDGEEALAMLESSATLPDLIILDYILPK